MYFHALKNRNILYYLGGAGITQIGNVLAGLAFLYISYDLTKSAGLTTITAIAQAVPYLLFGLTGGVLADRVDKKKLLIRLDLVRVPIILSLVVLDWSGHLVFWHLLFISFIIQSIGCFYNPAYRAVLPLITPEEDQTAVNSLLDIVTRGVQVIGPVIGIGLLQSGHTIHFYTIDSVTYLASAWFIVKLQWNEKRAEKEEAGAVEGIFSSIRSFFYYVKGQKGISTLFKITFTAVFFNTWVWEVGLLMLLMEEYSGKGEALFSLLLSWYGAGVILINLILPLIWKTLTLPIYLWGSAIWGAGITVIGFAGPLPVYFAGVFITAVGLPISSLARVYLIQTLVPKDKHGRAFSFNAVLLYGSNVLSLLLFGYLSSVVPVRVLFFFCGIMMTASSVVYLIRIVFPKKSGWKSVQPFK